MVTAGRQRARRGSGSVRRRDGRWVAQVSLGVGLDGRRVRPTRSFPTEVQARDWIEKRQAEAARLDQPVVDERLDVYLRSWLAEEAPKGRPGRRPLARTTLATYRNNVERHLVPALGHTRIGDLRVRDLDDFAAAKLADGYAPSSVNRIRETLRAALATAVRQERLARNVARYGGGVGTAPPPVDRFTTQELAAILAAAVDLHHYPIVLLMARTGLRLGEACGLRWQDVDLTTRPPRLSVVWQLDRWGELVHPKSRASRRTVPLRPEVADELVRWRRRQEQRALGPAGDVGRGPGLVFTTRNGRPVWTCNVSRSFTRVRHDAGVAHGSVKTLRSTVATQLAEVGVHPRKAQMFLGHARMSTTMRYYIAVSDVDEVAARLPDLPEIST